MVKLSTSFFEMLNHELANTANGASSIAQLMVDESSLSHCEVVELGHDLSDVAGKTKRLLARLKVLTQAKYYTAQQALNLEHALPKVLQVFNLLPKSISISASASSHSEMTAHPLVFEVVCDTLISILIYENNDLFLPEQTLRIESANAPDKGLRFVCSNAAPLEFLSGLAYTDDKLTNQHAFNLQTLYFLRECYDLSLLPTKQDTGFSITLSFPNSLDQNSI